MSAMVAPAEYPLSLRDANVASSAVNALVPARAIEQTIFPS